MVIGNAVCKDARMKPNVFRRFLSSWACRDNQTLDVNDSNWRCISGLRSGGQTFLVLFDGQSITGFIFLVRD